MIHFHKRVEKSVWSSTVIMVYCNCQCFLLCTMLISVLCGLVHVCNYMRFMCLFAFTVILILFTVTTLWTCPVSFCNDLWMKYNTIQYNYNYNELMSHFFSLSIHIIFQLLHIMMPVHLTFSVQSYFLELPFKSR
jgi:hypothetical protein